MLIGSFPARSLEPRYVWFSLTGYDVHAMFPQVEVEGGHHTNEIIKIIDSVIRDKVPLSEAYSAKINQDAFWKLVKVTDVGGLPLKTGRYSIQNAENGPISRGPEPKIVGSEAPVVKSVDPAYVSHIVQSIPSK